MLSLTRFQLPAPAAACLGLLLAAAQPAVAADEESKAVLGTYPLVPRPLCPPGVQPPERILPTWYELDQVLPAAGDTAEPAATETDVTQPGGGEADEAATDTPENEPVVAAAVPSAPPVLIEANRMELVQDAVSRLEGDVWVQQGERFLSTEALEFDEDTGIARTLAPAQFGTRQLLFNAENAVYDTSTGRGTFRDTDYYLLQRGARGEAEVLARTGEFTAELEGVKYTSCPAEDEDWWLKASSMDLDQEEGTGIGRNVRLAFMGVPFFYVPWISFPITEDRKTGFLFPEFNDSSRNGASIRVPYYLNLAPNYDATLTPNHMSERGTMLEADFRYLFRWGAGTLSANYLPDDSQTETERYFYRLAHASNLPGDWRFGVNYQEVSDEEYFQDFSQRSTLISHLAQGARLYRNTLEYGTSIGLLRYQTVDPTIPEARRPYEKWPEVDYYYAPLPIGKWLWFETEGESVNFQRDDRLSGWRHHNETSFSVDLGDPGLHATPKLAWWQTEYDLEQPDGTALNESRGIPVASLDAEAVFVRTLSGGGQQTLQPRLYYLRIPYREQNDLPRFDTRLGSDTLSQLFRPNRFAGNDRVGDENRMTLGVRSALIGEDGREWFNAAVARAWFLDDRRVTLAPDDPVQTEAFSDIYAAAEYLPSPAHALRADARWEPGSGRINFGSLQYAFRAGGNALLNAAYRYRREPAGSSTLPLEQVDGSFTVPVGERWQLFGAAVYSLQQDRSLETLAGFEYENCCWAFRTFSRRFIFNREGEFDHSIWFQLELKGLSSVGRRIDEFLVDNIYGYGEIP